MGDCQRVLTIEQLEESLRNCGSVYYLVRRHEDDDWTLVDSRILPPREIQGWQFAIAAPCIEKKPSLWPYIVGLIFLVGLIVYLKVPLK